MGQTHGKKEKIMPTSEQLRDIEDSINEIVHFPQETMQPIHEAIDEFREHISSLTRIKKNFHYEIIKGLKRIETTDEITATLEKEKSLSEDKIKNWQNELNNVYISLQLEYDKNLDEEGCKQALENLKKEEKNIEEDHTQFQITLCDIFQKVHNVRKDYMSVLNKIDICAALVNTTKTAGLKSLSNLETSSGVGENLKKRWEKFFGRLITTYENYSREKFEKFQYDVEKIVSISINLIPQVTDLQLPIIKFMTEMDLVALEIEKLNSCWTIFQEHKKIGFKTLADISGRQDTSKRTVKELLMKSDNARRISQSEKEILESQQFFGNDNHENFQSLQVEEVKTQEQIAMIDNVEIMQPMYEKENHYQKTVGQEISQKGQNVQEKLRAIEKLLVELRNSQNQNETAALQTASKTNLSYTFFNFNLNFWSNLVSQRDGSSTGKISLKNKDNSWSRGYLPIAVSITCVVLPFICIVFEVWQINYI